MTTKGNGNKRLLREGQKLFMRELGQHLSHLAQLTAELGTATADAASDSALQLYRIAHTLKGSAGVFGFGRIGVLAERAAQLWEWTQEQPEDASRVSPLETDERLRTALAAMPAVLRELELEYDISRVELDLDGSQEQAKLTLNDAANSRLLVIDDDDVMRSYLVRRLQLDGYEVAEASDVDAAKRLLRERAFDLITLDLVMHPHPGYELFEFLKEDPTLQWIPTVVLSGRDDVADKVRCFHLGADDYVTKPFQYEELAARIYSLLKRTKNFEQLAFRDPLTGVYNRRYFDNLIKVELQRVERYPAPFSIVFFDIDRFKTINDTYGHHIGDLVLQGLAYMVGQRLRGADMLARYGGEEFVIAMPNTSAAQAAGVMELILEQVRMQPTAQCEGQEYRITFSAGVAEWKPGLSIGAWLQKADSAMYQAKQQGRNRIIVAGSETPDAAESDAAAAMPAIRRAILVADDDSILRSIVVGRLREMPVDIVEAGDGEETFRLLSSHPFDLVILDAVMPGMDGFSVLERLGKEAGVFDRQRTKVLMLSGKKKEADMAHGYRLGAHDYMSKPFSLVELDMRIKRLLEL